MLTQPTAGEAVRNQFARNLYGRSGILGSLLALQVIGVAIAFFGSNGFGTADGQVSINVVDYSANPVIGLTLLWALIAPLYLSGRDSLRSDFIFPGSRATRHIGNSLYFAALVLAGSLTTTLAFMASVLFAAIPGEPLILPGGGVGYYVSLFVVLSGCCLLVASGSYFAGTLFSVSRFAAFALFALVLVFFRLLANVDPPAILVGIFKGPAALFFLKTLLGAVLFFIGAIIAGSRQEVKE
ncbi:hypothetical protein AV656_06300 [Bhargavaea cecembensis]|uniref:Uncharacterized protein n=2 Tax=Bhargavaea cecembensis TaxID=394098 RepID=A0A161SLH9_9BACL|nr:hypothetical protein AV656_06300 [Bhargavaea cecembensis]